MTSRSRARHRADGPARCGRHARLASRRPAGCRGDTPTRRRALGVGLRPDVHRTTGANWMTRRIAIVSDAAGYVGPNLARLLASDHDLVLGDPAPGLADELSAMGATVEIVEGVRDLSKPESSERLVT